MIVKKLHFPQIISDNEATYFLHLEAAIHCIDVNASLQITRRIEGINIRIAPSDFQYLLPTLKEVERIHNSLGLRMEYSKSMKSSASINFNINF